MARNKNADQRYFRIIDVNVNRCREGLRVIEDTARFVFDNERIYKKARTLRHRVDLITRRLYPELLRQRDSRSDPGRTIPEKKRERLGSVIAANFRRAEESLRVLEEYSRLVAPVIGPQVKEIRYRVYCLEKEFRAE
jgi:thiamine-phosphate pyrophosphorylase